MEKGLTNGKALIRKKAEHCLLTLFQISEDFQASVEVLNGLANNKNKKVAACGIQAIAILLDNFGLRKVLFLDYSQNMLVNAQGTNPAIKTATYGFYKAAYKWIRSDKLVLSLQDHLKKIQITEI